MNWRVLIWLAGGALLGADAIVALVDGRHEWAGSAFLAALTFGNAVELWERRPDKPGDEVEVSR